VIGLMQVFDGYHIKYFILLARYFKHCGKTNEVMARKVFSKRLFNGLFVTKRMLQKC
tara:strand:+ start:548 stop:718 length:171 start_codon:yes stop_codon:yes gene_type:complete